MIVKISLVTAGEAAHILQLGLGSMRQWRDFLADNIRGRQDIEGLTLMPRAMLRGPVRLAPAYAVADIKAFILAVRAADPGTGKKMKAIQVMLDSTRSWRVSKFDRGGSPVAILKGHSLNGAAFND